jgi:hypothetical protein
MALELLSWHRVVMALVWPWVYGLGRGLEGSGLGLGLEISALTTILISVSVSASSSYVPQYLFLVPYSPAKPYTIYKNSLRSVFAHTASNFIN